MNKEYRDMTAEERLRVINAAINKDGFVELKKIMDEFEIVLSIPETKSQQKINRETVSEIRNRINNEGLAGFAEYPTNTIQHPKESQPITPDLEQGSIYASEHRELAMEENEIDESAEISKLEQPKSRVLEKGTFAPNPWGDAEIVLPGQLKL